MYYLPRGNIEPASLELLPKGEPDETLRSIIARYSLTTSTEVKTAVFRKLFQRACLNCRFYTEDLRILTLQAAPLGQADTIYSRMLYENTFHSFIHNFGEEYSDSYQSRNMVVIDDTNLSDSKFCICCIKSDIDTLGFPFWRRSHQVPGVLCCWKHFTPLRKIMKSSSTLLDSRRLFDTKKIQADEDVTVAKTVSDHEIQLAIFARDSLSTRLFEFGPLNNFLESRKKLSISRFAHNYILNYKNSFRFDYSGNKDIARTLLTAYKIFGTIDVLESSLESI